MELRELQTSKLYGAKLEKYHFKGMHASHIGAVVSALEYLNIPSSPSWTFGMTGHAFIIAVDDKLSRPNVGLPDQKLFELSENLGIKVEGIHKFAEGDHFVRLQIEAWNRARNAINHRYPVFAKEIDLGNETSLIYAYNETGYFTHSWHSGSGHENFDDMIPWEMLGHSYCPCFACGKEREKGITGKDSSVKNSKDKQSGLISLHWVTPGEKKDDRESLNEAISFVLQFEQQGPYEWDHSKIYPGLKAYDHWIHAIADRSILAFYMGYLAEIWYESRQYAYQFLLEVKERIPSVNPTHLLEALACYDQIQQRFKQLSHMFPWMQPHEPIDDPERSEAALRLLKDIRAAEEKGLEALARLIQ